LDKRQGGAPFIVAHERGQNGATTHSWVRRSGTASGTRMERGRESQQQRIAPVGALQRRHVDGQLIHVTRQIAWSRVECTRVQREVATVGLWRAMGRRDGACSSCNDVVSRCLVLSFTVTNAGATAAPAAALRWPATTQKWAWHFIQWHGVAQGRWPG
jgi:hypothetical protein